MKVGQTGFPNWLNVEWERKRRVKDDFKVSGPSNWVNSRTMCCNKNTEIGDGNWDIKNSVENM